MIMTKCQERKAKGLCITCGKSKPDENYSMCQFCCTRARKYYQNRKKKREREGTCIDCASISDTGLIYCRNCQKRREKYRDRVRDQVFNNYGGYICACCGENNPKFLTIDHINNDGAQHRKEIGSGERFYQWLIKKNFPKEYRVLCMNCNWARRHGPCPHEEEYNLLVGRTNPSPSIAGHQRPGRCSPPSP